MKKIALCILLLALLPSECGAIDLDIDNYSYGPPKNTDYRYGGIVGAALDEIENQLRDQAYQYITLRYDAGIIDLSEANREFSLIGTSSWGFKPLTWFERMPTAKGGMPISTIVVIGPSKDFANNGLFKLDHKFGFKLKDHEFQHLGDPILRNWKMRIRPSASFSSKTLFNHIGIGFYFDYRPRRVRLFELGILGRYSMRNGLEVSVVFQLTNF
jgi:hypothetical protein